MCALGLLKLHTVPKWKKSGLWSRAHMQLLSPARTCKHALKVLLHSFETGSFYIVLAVLEVTE